MDIRSYWENTFRKFREEMTGDLPVRSALETGSQATAAFTRLLPPGGRILDFGCGPGRNALAFAERGFQVDVCDISEEAVRLCLDLARKVEAPIAAVPLLDGRRVEVPSHSYDGVLALAVLDHVTFEMAMALAVEFNRILTPGGLALLTLDSLAPAGGEDDPHEVLMDGTVLYTGGAQTGLLYRRYGNREVMDLFSIGWEPLVFLAADADRPRDFLFRCDKRRARAIR